MSDKEFSPIIVLMAAISKRKPVAMVLASLLGGLALPAIAAEEPVSFVCRYDPAPCADNAATPLGLTYARALRILTGQHEESEWPALRQAIAARPDDLGARLQLIASGADERDAAVILTDLDAWTDKAHKAGDPLAAAITGLLSIRQLKDGDDDDDDGADNINIAKRAKIAFADIEACRKDSKAKDIDKDRSELMAGLAYRYAMFLLPKLKEQASAAAIASFQARLNRKPEDKARLDLTAEALSLGLEGDEAPTRADRLIELRRKLAALMPDDEQVQQTLVAAYVQRADQARERGQEDVVRQDITMLRDLAEQDIKANRFSAPAAGALYEVYRLEASGLIKADPAKAGSVLIDGMTRFAALRTRDPVFGGHGARLAWPLLDAIDSLVSESKTADAKALENRALTVMPPGTAPDLFQRKLAGIYQHSGAREEAASRYRLILAGLRAKPAAIDTARGYFESLDALFEIGRADRARFDVNEFVQLALNYLRAPGFDELTKAVDGGKGDDKADDNRRLLERVADNLHDLADHVEDIGADEATIPLYAAEVSLRESLARDPARRAEQIGDLGSAYRKLCLGLKEASHYAEAEAPCSKAVDIRREEATKRSFAFDELENYVWALRDLADLQDSLERTAEAMETLNEGQRIADTLLKRFPRQSGSYRATAIIATEMGNVAKTPSARLSFHRKAEAANLAELKALGPEDFDYDYLAVSQMNIGDAHADLNDRPNAIASFEQALVANDKSLKQEPEDLEHLRRRARITRMLAREQRALGRNKEAIASLRLQIEVLETLKDITGKADDGLFPTYWSIIGLLRQEGGDPAEIATFQAKAQSLKE